MRRGLSLFVFVALFALDAHCDGRSKEKATDVPKDLRVDLLPAFAGDTELAKGMPVSVGGKIRIPYVCHGTTGVAKATLLYRVLRKGGSEDEPWVRLLLSEVKATDKTGPFNPKTGVFERTSSDEQVPFHAIASDLQAKQPRVLGGGRVLLVTRGLVEGKEFKPVELKPGDRIEYYIAVEEIGEKGASAVFVRSPSRISDVITLLEFQDWLRRQAEKESRELKGKETSKKSAP